MRICRLDIRDLRILDRLTINPSAGLNFIVGGNGAGKTSVLEAIYLAGRGRSFRHATAGPMIRRQAEETVVTVDLHDEVTGIDHHLGVRRGRSVLECRLDGEGVKKRSTLVDALPVQWLGSQPQVFLDRGPDVRRRFVDMGLFHVEPGFAGIYTEFNRIQRQRNAALKAGNVGAVMAWDASFCAIGERLTEQRRNLTASLVEGVQSILSEWDSDLPITINYRAGWRRDETLSNALARKLELDLTRGFTSVGPQRAEIELLSEGAAAENSLSRGQQKMLVIGLQLALIDILIRVGRSRPIVLIDDLAAELDEGNQRRVLTTCQKRQVQSFVTAITEPLLMGSATEVDVFHVEQGQLSD